MAAQCVTLADVMRGGLGAPPGALSGTETLGATDPVAWLTDTQSLTVSVPCPGGGRHANVTTATPGSALLAARRRHEYLERRARGESYGTIGREMGVNESTVRRVVSR